MLKLGFEEVGDLGEMGTVVTVTITVTEGLMKGADE